MRALCKQSALLVIHDSMMCLSLTGNMSITCQFNTNTEMSQMINSHQTNKGSLFYTVESISITGLMLGSPDPMWLSSTYCSRSPKSSGKFLLCCPPASSAPLTSAPWSLLPPCSLMFLFMSLLASAPWLSWPLVTSPHRRLASWLLGRRCQ